MIFEIYRARASLLNFFVDGVSVAMTAVLFDFKSCGCIATVFASGVAGNAVSALVGIGAAFGAFHGDGIAYAFLACHIVS